jgi:hypothetical protein
MVPAVGDSSQLPFGTGGKEAVGASVGQRERHFGSEVRTIFRLNAPVVRRDSNCVYRCAYRLVSTRCILLRFVAVEIRAKVTSRQVVYEAERVILA